MQVLFGFGEKKAEKVAAKAESAASDVKGAVKGAAQEVRADPWSLHRLSLCLVHKYPNQGTRLQRLPSAQRRGNDWCTALSSVVAHQAPIPVSRTGVYSHSK